MVVRTLEADAVLFCRLKGDCRPVSGVKARSDYKQFSTSSKWNLLIFSHHPDGCAIIGGFSRSYLARKRSLFTIKRLVSDSREPKARAREFRCALAQCGVKARETTGSNDNLISNLMHWRARCTTLDKSGYRLRKHGDCICLTDAAKHQLHGPK